MCDKTPFQQEVISKAKAHKLAIDMVFGRSYPAKNEGVTHWDLTRWLADNECVSPRYVTNKGRDQVLLIVETINGEHKTFVMSELLERIERER